MTTQASLNAMKQDKSEFLRFEDRDSDHPFVEKVWRCHSERADSFLSVAASNFEMAITRLGGRSFLTLRGPETKAAALDCPAEGEWIGIRFKVGAFMPRLLPGSLRDHKDLTLPSATGRSFWLNGSGCHSKSALTVIARAENQRSLLCQFLPLKSPSTRSGLSKQNSNTKYPNL